MATTRSYPDMERPNPAVEQAMQSLQHKPSYKRKRDSSDQNGNRKHSNHRPTSSNHAQANGHAIADPSQDIFSNDSNSNDFNNIGQHIARHLAGPSTAAATLVANMPHMTVPQPTELSFPSTSGNDGERQLDSSFDMGGGSDGDQNPAQGATYNLDAYQGNSGAQTQGTDGGGGGIKPAVGTDEWHKVRRDNHKEVERRRRETINEGINELAKIVPNCEKNKGSILQRGVQYITQLRENERINIEKWTLEKMLTDQAIGELSAALEREKDELAKSRRETERWKKACLEAGLEPKDDDGGSSDDDGDT
ncbi:transcriptional regulator CBF1, partial [Lecanoromycetidae sp. Uapishka_2]